MSDRFLVLCQLILIGFIVLPIPRFWPPVVAIIIFAVGELLLLWVIVHNRFGNWSIYPKPKRDAVFINTGPYRLVRHPMYLGLLKVLLSFVCWQPSALRVGAFSLLTLLLIYKINREESYLSASFSEWRDYSHRLPYRLVPKVW